MNSKVKPIYSSRMPLSSKMETVGGAFKKEREKQKKTLESISLETRIDEKKLQALEENNFTVFESPVNTKGFIKIYAQYLGLNPEKILAMYRRDFGEKLERKDSTPIQEEKKIQWRYFYFLIPILIVLSLLFYLYNQFYNFQNPPALEIFEPKNNSTVNEEILTIRGKTDIDTTIDIGEMKIPVDKQGYFETKIPLELGKNIFSVRATNARNTSRESIKILHITFEKEIEEIQEEQVENIKLNLKVENSPTWVEVIVDDQMIITQILPVGYEESFEAQKNIQVNTGILQNTKVEINGVGKGLSPETFSIRCEITEKILECK